MNQQWQELQEKINALNQRERIIVMVTVLAVVVMVVQWLLIDPALAERKKLQLQSSNLKQQLQQQQGQVQVLEAQITAGVNRHKEQRKQQLADAVAEMDRQIQQSVVAMIPPRLMPEVLENILSHNKELKLVSLENRPVVPLIEEGDEIAGNASVKKLKKRQPEPNNPVKQGLYNHGFVLTLSGNYMAAIRYFEELSQLPWQFYWDDLRYEVDRYPNATITLKVHTVSMSEDWIGV